MSIVVTSFGLRRLPDRVASEADELRVAILVWLAPYLRVARKTVLRWTARGAGSKIGGDQMGDFRYALPLKELFADKVLKFPDLLSRELR
jgi:hypothetical protein